jgi:hypothetical protein
MRWIPLPPNSVTPRFPDPLIEERHAVLLRYGYRLDGTAVERDWIGMWRLLQGDFATKARPWVAGYENLTARQQEAARIYMRRRLIADELLDACKRAHEELHRAGIDPELVERYALARDAYEDAVMDFGRAREQVEALLPAGAPP